MSQDNGSQRESASALPGNFLKIKIPVTPLPYLQNLEFWAKRSGNLCLFNQALQAVVVSATVSGL